jgi:hypothetical protein
VFYLVVFFQLTHTGRRKSMSSLEHLGTYAEGWTKGDAETILKVVTENYTFDDPNTGVISKNEFSNYMAGLKETVSSLRGGTLSEIFMEISEVLTDEKEGILTAWCWWAIPGTGIKGSGLIKVGSEGVRSEVITYYTRLPG